MQKTVFVIICMFSVAAFGQEKENFCQTYMNETQDFLTVRVHGPNGVENQLQTLRYSGHIGQHPETFYHTSDAWLVGKDLINFNNHGGTFWVEEQYIDRNYQYSQEPFVDFYRTYDIQRSFIPRIFSFEMIVDGKVCDCRVGRSQKIECAPLEFPNANKESPYGICHYILDNVVDYFAAVSKRENDDLFHGYLHKKQGMERSDFQNPSVSSLIPIRYLDFCGYEPQHKRVIESLSNHSLPFEAIDFHFGYQGVMCECSKDFMTDNIRCLSNMD